MPTADMNRLPFDLTVIMYHYVRDPGDAAEAGSGIPGMPVAAFETQLDMLARWYEFVAWPAVRAHLLEERDLPPNACLLTFDDGVSDHYLNVFPRLRDRGLSGLFFALARPAGAGLTLPHQLHFLLAKLGMDRLRALVADALDPAARQCLVETMAEYLAGALPFAKDNPTEAFKAALQREMADEAQAALGQLLEAHIGPERELAEGYYLSASQVGEMAAGGMHFGGHGQAHPWLDFVDDGALARELSASAAWLARLAPGPFAFAYPFGGFDVRTPAALAAAGFCAAFTTRAEVRHDSAFHINRLDGEWLPPAGEGDAAWLRQERRYA
jgi:peptidoglycan/xylan/chitin deacetylase (PgdA/CDA1 family)